jgi:hypothetical protein
LGVPETLQPALHWAGAGADDDRVTTRPAVALRGTLDDFSASEILRLLEETRQTGVLRVSGEGSGSMWLTDGFVYYGETGSGVPLREAVVRSGMVTEPGWDAAVAQAEAGAALLDSLVAQGSSSRTTLEAFLTERVVDTMFEFLVLLHSQFEFAPGERHLFSGAPAQDVNFLLSEGHARLERWREVAAVIPSTAIVVHVCATLPPTLPNITLSAEEFRVLAAIDGRRSVADITRLLGASAFSVCGTLHRLVTMGVCSAG